MEQRGVFLKLSEDNINTIKRIAQHNTKLKMVHIIRTFLEALKDMSPDCKILIYDNHQIRSLDHFDKVVYLSDKYKTLDLKIKLEHGAVSVDAAALKIMGGGLE